MRSNKPVHVGREVQRVHATGLPHRVDVSEVRRNVRAGSLYMTQNTGPERYLQAYRELGYARGLPDQMAIHLGGHVGRTWIVCDLWRERSDLEAHFSEAIVAAVSNVMRDHGAATDDQGRPVDIEPDIRPVEDFLLSADAASFVDIAEDDDRQSIHRLGGAPVMMNIRFPAQSAQDYESLMTELGFADALPVGLIAHAAGDARSGRWIAEVWRDEATARSYLEDGYLPALARVTGDSSFDEGEQLLVVQLERLVFGREIVRRFGY